MRNLADVPGFAVGSRGARRADCRRGWTQTADPLLDGPVPAPAGALVNDPAGVSASEPYLD